MPGDDDPDMYSTVQYLHGVSASKSFAKDELIHP